MDPESWDNTPFTSNEVESAHAGKNAESSGINLPLLEAIMKYATLSLQLLFC
jgi:hypothetical protein